MLAIAGVPGGAQSAMGMFPVPNMTSGRASVGRALCSGKAKDQAIAWGGWAWMIALTSDLLLYIDKCICVSLEAMPLMGSPSGVMIASCFGSRKPLCTPEGVIRIVLLSRW